MGAVPAEIIACHELELSDVGNAHRFELNASHDFIYLHDLERWYLWDGRRWAPDVKREAFTRAIETAKGILDEAKRYEGERLKAFIKHALQSQRAERLEAMLRVARALARFKFAVSDLDQDPYALNVENGLLDLRHGTLSDAGRFGSMVTKVAPAPYYGEAKCPTWEKFLDRVLGGSLLLIEYVQRAVGYSLTGDVSEQVLFFLYGTGKNGKSTFLETIRALLGEGEYCKAAQPDLLLAKKFDRHAAELADLRGARMVTTIEAGEGRAWDEARLKLLTGGDAISARYMYGNPFTFMPTHKFWVAANHKPRVNGTDLGFWRRIHTIPFSQVISAEERDPHLKERLLEELPGIMRWAVRGCLEWKWKGLEPPEEVQGATDAYRAGEDVLALFLEEKCTKGPDRRVLLGSLFREYQEWAQRSGERQMTKRGFSEAMEERGFTKSRTGVGVWIDALGLRAAPALEEPAE